jgi:hypothetical protein
MKVQYGDARLLLQQVYEWTRKFMNSISSVTDSPQPAAGGARVAALSAKIFFLFGGIHVLLKRWNTCIEHTGDYIEK